jgi:hypothetical protein
MNKGKQVGLRGSQQHVYLHQRVQVRSGKVIRSIEIQDRAIAKTFAKLSAWFRFVAPDWLVD